MGEGTVWNWEKAVFQHCQGSRRFEVGIWLEPVVVAWTVFLGQQCTASTKMPPYMSSEESVRKSQHKAPERALLWRVPPLFRIMLHAPKQKSAMPDAHSPSVGFKVSCHKLSRAMCLMPSKQEASHIRLVGMDSRPVPAEHGPLQTHWPFHCTPWVNQSPNQCNSFYVQRGITVKDWEK